MKNEILSSLYRDAFTTFGSTAEYQKAEDTLCNRKTAEETSEAQELFAKATDTECKNAFTAGFYAAVSLLTGGVQS